MPTRRSTRKARHDAAERKRRAVEIAARIEALGDDKIIERFMILIDPLEECQKGRREIPPAPQGGSQLIN